ncbi:aminotransferase class V-fold PLP-dependent enzyme [Clostridium cylindrosporum]|uniref:Putative cysteine desulfurase Csd n=1 Tax=Clostridium cylindrosporum DSM 605 TaxID=1121307 RepID=A0A0J8DBG4_CLOCY|nr:aminotransferase class V-fold PLP-dependent enzyme [Clostridium cylindrosporum]KMT23182.1 putative cysteine desulfurase Csd [Clostridium cylindrosporum DSM 605]
MNKKLDYRKLFAGINMPVALEDGRCVVPINFDNAATTPPFKCVNNMIIQNILMYGSIGRGKGQKSEYCTDAYEEAREFILDFFNLSNRKDYTVIYVKNATEGINLLARSLIKESDEVVLTTRMEHHANDIPWRYVSKVEYIDVDENGKIDINDIEKKLKNLKGKVKFVSISGASNVTGYINDINKIAQITHKYGAKIVVDAAQLIAHRAINMAGNENDDHIDFMTFSGHKLYAPFGSGVVVGLREAFNDGNLFLYGGGAVEAVLDDNVYWQKSPGKYEAGTPNFIGVIALVTAMKSLISIGFDNIKTHEDELRDHAIKKLSNIDRIVLYGDSKCTERLGVVPFNIEGVGHNIVAERLADYRAIAVRHGGFCAHSYVRRLLGISNEKAYNYIINGVDMPGMVRASFGLYNTTEEIDEFIDVLKKIITRHIK